MADHNPLKIVETESKAKPEGWIKGKHNYRQETQAKFDRLWHTDAWQFDPLRIAMERERLQRTMELIERHVKLREKKVVDLGCGSGIFSKRLRDQGAAVEAVDISTYAIAALEKESAENIKTSIDYVPRTSLPDEGYDLVVASELIAYLHIEEHRLFISELARIVKPSGMVIASTPLDINSDDALQRYGVLSETEFVITEWKLSHHKFWIRLHDFLAAPERFARARTNPSYRNQKLAQRFGFSKFWFKINSAIPLAFIWAGVQYLTRPLNAWSSQSNGLLLFLEKLCRSLSPVRGISHAIWIGKRRPLVEKTPVEDRPIDRPGKKQIWE